MINTSNRDIIEYTIRSNSLCYNIHCLWSTKLRQTLNDLLFNGKWYWGDIEYFFTPWLIIPYKKYNKSKKNQDFNYALSKVCIQKKTTIGYLPEQFQLLRKLWMLINSAQDLSYASFWIQNCVVLQAILIHI